jgi:hypothetical protein
MPSTAIIRLERAEERAEYNNKEICLSRKKAPRMLKSVQQRRLHMAALHVGSFTRYLIINPPANVSELTLLVIMTS